MNKVARSLTALALSAALAAGSALTTLAYAPETAKANAEVLNSLGLFKGTENGYELDKPLTRWVHRGIAASLRREFGMEITEI